MLSVGIIVVLSYLVGSIPTSIIVARHVRGIDIRQFGSGNAGGTNVLRVLGWRAGVFVIAMDIGKGLPFDDFTLVQIMAGCSAILGHVWTLFAGFKGGKGIATAAGMLLGIAPVEVGVSFGVFLIVVLISQYVSLGSLSAAVSFPLTMFFRENVFMVDIQGYNTLIFFSLGIALLIIYTHRKNITRLLKGTELKFSTSRLSGGGRSSGAV